jgi:hypothetical protein
MDALNFILSAATSYWYVIVGLWVVVGMAFHAGEQHQAGQPVAPVFSLISGGRATIKPPAGGLKAMKTTGAPQ